MPYIPRLDQVINTVGAFNLRATLNCDAFASEHSSTAHYDARSFVGLAVRLEAELGYCKTAAPPTSPGLHACTCSGGRRGSRFAAVSFDNHTQPSTLSPALSAQHSACSQRSTERGVQSTLAPAVGKL